MVQYYARRLINFSVPAIYRYLLKSAEKQSGFFNRSFLNKEAESWHEDYITQMNMPEKEKTKLFRLGKDLSNINSKWSNKINKLMEAK